MNKNEAVSLLRSLGFKPWGGDRPYKGGRYQCFRKANHYAWLGNYYLEVNTKMHAHDYVNHGPKEAESFLNQ